MPFCSGGVLEANQSVDQSKNGAVLILVPLQFIHGINRGIQLTFKRGGEV